MKHLTTAQFRRPSRQRHKTFIATAASIEKAKQLAKKRISIGGHERARYAALGKGVFWGVMEEKITYNTP
ncbi:hypothetical protein CSA80_05070 [Candidatus Saccharibacteria bacterium]|nr:MAG: hypothetical protein CR973_01325 [Candidatus Saccharibacteria bacterium]PID98704.1 MAG: hypothetical protein CSA80_05070 [Candidatus Saccharibacteria bacterium]